MTILDRALRLGEGKQFKQYAKRVDRINSWEPELELLDDDELRQQADGLRERARNGGVARRPAARDVRPGARGLAPPDGHAPLRRPDDRRHGAPLRLDRRDEDRRGQDADRHARRGAQRARRRGRPRRHRQRLPRPPRRRVDEPDLQRARPVRRRAAEHAALRGEARRLRGRHHLRHQLRVRLRLPARQHGGLAWRRRSSTAGASPRRASRSPPTTTRSSTRSTTSSSTRPARR